MKFGNGFLSRNDKSIINIAQAIGFWFKDSTDPDRNYLGIDPDDNNSYLVIDFGGDDNKRIFPCTKEQWCELEAWLLGAERKQERPPPRPWTVGHAPPWWA